MKKCFITTFMLFCLIPLNAQVYNYIYKVQNLSNNVDINISFNPDGVYLMEYCNAAVDDLPMFAILSYGKYEEMDNVVNLIDYLHDFTMVFEKSDGNSLIARNSFRNIINKPVSCFIAGYTDPIKAWEIPNTSIKLIRKEIEKWEQSFPKQKKCEVKTGLYYGSILEKDDYAVFIQNDGTFSVKLYGNLLLQGTWRLYKNVIHLFDPLLNTTFFLLMDGNNLIGKSLPGQYDDIVLKMSTALSPQKQKRNHLKGINKRNNEKINLNFGFPVVCRGCVRPEQTGGSAPEKRHRRERCRCGRSE